MSDSRHCPVCGSNIGIWSVFKAPLPNRIFCPKCGQRLQHTPITGLVTVAVILIVLLCVVAGYFIIELWDDKNVFSILPGGAVLFLGGMVIETAFVTILWYGDYELKVVGKSRSVGDMDRDAW
jgi:hypothetical protein